MRANLSAIALDLNSALLERSEVIHGLMLALLSRRHIFLLGPPGTAKSLLTDATVERVAGARVFKLLMTRYTTPEEVLGPVSLSALKADRFERSMGGYLPDAHLAFLDECFKANSSILNALLGLLNERTVRNGTNIVKCPLVTCVGASNELPQGEDLGALYDRFLLRYFVPYIQEESSFSALLTLEAQPARAGILLADLEAAQKEVKAVAIPPEVVAAVVELRLNLSAEHGITRSDRCWRESMRLLRAEAWLAGRNACTREDLCVLANVLWSDPAARDKVASAVVGYSVPGLARVLELVDEAVEQHRVITTTKGKDPTSRANRSDAAEKFRTIRQEFEGASANVPGSRMAALAARFNVLRAEVSKAML